MRLNKLTILFLFLLARLTMSADIALPKSERNKVAQVAATKYYFANVDSFSNYSFSVQKNNGKIYKLKQDAAFVVNPNDGIEKNQLEVWAVSKKDNQKTNSFFLAQAKLPSPLDANTAYIAISFYFDKNNKLSYTQTVMKPDCYSKKQFVPFISFKKPTNNLNQLIYISLFSFLVLLSVFIISKMKPRNAYV